MLNSQTKQIHYDFILRRRTLITINPSPLGDGGVGKSCLMNRFVANQYDDGTFHTIGVEFLNKDLEVDGVKYTLQIWDTAGQERFRALRTPFYRGSDVCLLCYAIDDHDSFDSLANWREEFLKYADIPSEQQFPFIVVGNKNDLPATERNVTMEEVTAWCDVNQISSHIETSAKQSKNVTEAFGLAVKQWIRMERSADREQRGVDLVDLTRRVNVSGSNGGCCGGSGNSSGGSRDSSASRGNNMSVDRNNQL